MSLSLSTVCPQATVCPAPQADVLSAPLGAAAVQHFLKEVPELCVKDGVDDRVESAVHIAEPRHHAHQGRRDAAVLTSRSHDVQNKERRPAEEKRSCRRTRKSEDRSFDF